MGVPVARPALLIFYISTYNKLKKKDTNMPLRETNRYEISVIDPAEAYSPEMDLNYSIINKETGVVEVKAPTLPQAIGLMEQLTEQLDEASPLQLNLVN